jgi:hypothetical protein
MRATNFGDVIRVGNLRDRSSALSHTIQIIWMGRQLELGSAVHSQGLKAKKVKLDAKIQVPSNYAQAGWSA